MPYVLSICLNASLAELYQYVFKLLWTCILYLITSTGKKKRHAIAYAFSPEIRYINDLFYFIFVDSKYNLVFL